MERKKILRSRKAHEPIKITVVSDYSYSAGGVPIFLEHIVRASSSDIQYSLVTWKNDLTESTKATNGFRGIFTDVALVGEGNVHQAVEIMRGSDLIFLQTSWNTRLLAPFAADFAVESGKPLITVCHTSSHSSPGSPSAPLQLKWFRSTLEASAKIICVSSAVESSLNSTLPSISHKALTILNASRYSGVTREFTPDLGGKDKTVTFAGRPTRAKGIHDFLRLAESLEDTTLKFVCNSVDPDHGNVISSLPGNVQHTHSLGEAEMLDFLHMSDVFVAPYYHSEGLPLVVLEALSVGVPVVGYESPGLKELLEPQQQFCVEVGRLDLLSSHLRSWHDGALALHAPNCEDVPNWKAAAAQYQNIIREILI